MSRTIQHFPILFLLLASATGAIAQESVETTVVILVRHAEKESGEDPALNEEGRIRARDLRDALLYFGVDVVVASQFKRTSETIQPLADTLGISVEIRPLDTTDVLASARAMALALADEFRGQTIVVAGHSNTIPAMASALVGVEIDSLDERDYDNLFIVVLPAEGEPQLIRAKYGANDLRD